MEQIVDSIKVIRSLWSLQIQNLIFFISFFFSPPPFPSSKAISQKRFFFFCLIHIHIPHPAEARNVYHAVYADTCKYQHWKQHTTAHISEKATMNHFSMLICIFTAFKFHLSFFLLHLNALFFPSLAACNSLFVTKEFFFWFISDCKVVYGVLHGE